MKKVFLWFVILSLLLCCFGGCAKDGVEPSVTESTEKETEETTLPPASPYRVAMITDYFDIDDMSFNQTTYEAGKAWCDANGVDFAYYKPTCDSTMDRVVAVEQAVADGYNVLLLPGFCFADTIRETAERYPDVKFIALDVGRGDFDDYVLPENVFSAVYQEELAGFLAGYAAVKMGYREIGFVGGIAVPAVLRYGYGFVQGVDHAAGELDVQVSVKYGYALQCFCDGAIQALQENVDQWFRNGTEAVFFCGGAISRCMEDAERDYDLKIIGVDVDEKESLDALYGEGTTLTSAMKNLSATVTWALSTLILADDWESLGGSITTLGLVSGSDLDKNHVALPDSTQWNDSFTKEDYAAIVNAVFTGAVTVDASIEQAPTTEHITIEYLGTLRTSDS